MGPATLDFVPAHPPGMAGIGYAGKDSTLRILSCGQDGQLCIHNPGDLTEKITKSMQAEDVACHCLAVNPEQGSFAAGDQGHFVKVCIDEICPLAKGAYSVLEAPAISCLMKYGYLIMTGLLQIYKLPDGTFDSVATRFSLPVRALAYSPSGTNLAAAGDDEGIKLISAAESKVLQRTIISGISQCSPSTSSKGCWAHACLVI